MLGKALTPQSHGVRSYSDFASALLVLQTLAVRLDLGRVLMPAARPGVHHFSPDYWPAVMAEAARASFGDAGLPKPLHAKQVEECLVTQQCQMFDLRLCNQHAVEGVAVVTWQQPGAARVLHGDRKR